MSRNYETSEMHIEMRSMYDERDLLNSLEHAHEKFLKDYESGDWQDDDGVNIDFGGDCLTLPAGQLLKLSPATLLEFYKDSIVENIEEYRDRLKEGDKPEKHLLH